MSITRITLEKGSKEVTVEMPSDNLKYYEFMGMVEMMLDESGYSKHEIESYILKWASDIKSANEN